MLSTILEVFCVNTLRKVGICFHVQPFDVFTSPLHLRYRPHSLVYPSVHRDAYHYLCTRAIFHELQTILHGPLKEYEREDAHAEREYLLVVPLLQSNYQGTRTKGLHTRLKSDSQLIVRTIGLNSKREDFNQL